MRRVLAWTAWSLALGAVAAGTVATICGWGDDVGWLGVGVAVSGVVAVFALVVIRVVVRAVCRHTRSSEVAFDAGYELGEVKGYRDGRRVPSTKVVRSLR